MPGGSSGAGEVDDERPLNDGLVCGWRSANAKVAALANVYDGDIVRAVHRVTGRADYRDHANADRDMALFHERLDRLQRSGKPEFVTIHDQDVLEASLPDPREAVVA